MSTLIGEKRKYNDNEEQPDDHEDTHEEGFTAAEDGPPITGDGGESPTNEEAPDGTEERDAAAAEEEEAAEPEEPTPRRTGTTVSFDTFRGTGIVQADSSSEATSHAHPSRLAVRAREISSVTFPMLVQGQRVAFDTVIEDGVAYATRVTAPSAGRLPGWNRRPRKRHDISLFLDLFTYPSHKTSFTERSFPG